MGRLLRAFLGGRKPKLVSVPELERFQMAGHADVRIVDRHTKEDTLPSALAPIRTGFVGRRVWERRGQRRQRRQRVVEMWGKDVLQLLRVLLLLTTLCSIVVRNRKERRLGKR